MDINIVLVILVVFAAQTVQSTAGFGFGILAMSMLPLFLPDYFTALCVTGSITVIGTAILVWRHRRHIDWKVSAPLIAGFFVSSLLATWIMTVIDSGFLKRIMGVMLVLFSLFSLFFSSRVRVRATVKNGLIAGALGGLTGGMFNMGGPPVVVFLLGAMRDNLNYIGTSQFYFLVTNAYLAVLRLIGGMYTVSALSYTGIGLCGMLLGLYAGAKIFKRLNREALRRFVYIFILLTGVWITVTG